MQFGNINWKQCRFITKNILKILKVDWNKKVHWKHPTKIRNKKPLFGISEIGLETQCVS